MVLPALAIIIIVAFAALFGVGLLWALFSQAGVIFIAAALFALAYVSKDIEFWKGKNANITMGMVALMIAVGFLAASQLGALSSIVSTIAPSSIISSFASGNAEAVQQSQVEPASLETIAIIVSAMVIAFVFLGKYAGSKAKVL